MRFSIDTNILVYATFNQDEEKHRATLRIMERAQTLDCVVTLQALGELFHTLTRRLKVSAGNATTVVHKWRSAIPVIAADGKAYEVRNRMTLCRCGQSNNKPFCDGSHAA